MFSLAVGVSKFRRQMDSPHLFPLRPSPSYVRGESVMDDKTHEILQKKVPAIENAMEGTASYCTECRVVLYAEPSMRSFDVWKRQI